MPTSVILVTSYDPSWLRVFEHVARTRMEAGDDVLVFDVTPLITTPVDSYHRGVMRALGLQHPGHDLERRMRGLGTDYLLADAIGPVAPEPLSDVLEAPLAMAVKSAVITFFRTDRPKMTKGRLAAIARGLTAEGRSIYRRVRDLSQRLPGISTAYVPNGRFPHQKMAVLGFDDADVTVRHLEKGQTADRVYVQRYSPHDRFQSQRDVDGVLDGLGTDEIDAIAEAWLDARAPRRGSHNEYSTLWSPELPAQIKALRDGGTPLAGFFTSSQDEFLFQGAEWQVHEWADQFAAFDVIMTRLEADGYVCYLRVHPNLATRAHDYYLRERAAIRRLQAAHPALVVIWHDDRASSYTLLEATDVVVVFASTIGVEASARGLPVWTAGASTYGEVADVREVFGPDAVTADDLHPWSVDPSGARRYIAYLVQRDERLHSDVALWTSWTGRRPLRATLAAIAVSGGTPGVGAAIWSLLDVYRHRSARASIRARRRA